MPTTPKNIWYPDNTAPVSPLENLFSQQATSVDTAIAALIQTVPSLVANQAARDALFPSATVTQGASVNRADLGWVEQYYAAVSTNNPGGVKTAGWYPVSGALPSVQASSLRGNIGTTQGVGANAGTSLKFSSTDVLNGISYSTATGVATVTQPGIYVVGGTARASAIPTAAQIQIAVNGTAQFVSKVSTELFQDIEASFYCASGDTVQVQWQDTAADTLTVTQKGFWMNYVRPA